MPHGHHLTHAARLSLKRVQAIYDAAKQVAAEHEATAALNANSPPNPQPLPEVNHGATAGAGSIQSQPSQ